MPRKINKRKKLQAARRKADKAATKKKKHPARVGMIAHPGMGGAALAMTLATMMKGRAQ